LWDQCTNKGRYCAVDPEHDLNTGITGEDIVRENLRQMCVFQYASSNNNPHLWWQYVNKFETDCAANPSTFTIECSDGILSTLGMKSFVSACVSGSGGYHDMGPSNSLIDKELAERRDLGVYEMPSVFVNNVKYGGSLTCNKPVDVATCGVLSEICNRYASGTQPNVCAPTDGCEIGHVRDDCGVCGGTGSFDACGVSLQADNPNSKKAGDTCRLA